VTVVDARGRVGGRVWTLRDGFRRHQGAEAGGDLIDSEQHAVIEFAKDLGLTLDPILKSGFGYCGTDRRGKPCIRSVERSFAAAWPFIEKLVAPYRLAEQRWDNAIAKTIGARSVAEWLKAIDADEALKRRFRGLRGLFLADPEELSLLALVDFFATSGFGEGHMLRVREGNDRLATEAARHLRPAVRLRTALRRVGQTDGRVTALLEDDAGTHELKTDYLISTLPASTLCDVEWATPIPDAQRDAIARLRYGRATRLLLQFQTRFWWKVGQPRAFGSDQGFGALWDGNERQRGPEGILSFLAGGRASGELQALLASEGLDGVVRQLSWLGRPSAVLASERVIWDDDPWARGGYAYFDPSFDPALRDWLARPAGRVLFAGEHTSVRWQGYMNGAIESGQRAAQEVRALARGARLLRG
jgi:monoamine oxidase